MHVYKTCIPIQGNLQPISTNIDEFMFFLSNFHNIVLGECYVSRLCDD